MQCSYSRPKKIDNRPKDSRELWGLLESPTPEETSCHDTPAIGLSKRRIPVGRTSLWKTYDDDEGTIRSLVSIEGGGLLGAAAAEPVELSLLPCETWLTPHVPQPLVDRPFQGSSYPTRYIINIHWYEYKYMNNIVYKWWILDRRGPRTTDR